MKRQGSGVSIVALLLLGGCVSAGKDHASRAGGNPRIEPILEGLIDEAPVWDARPVLADAQIAGNGDRYHRVASGETGIAIARAYRLTWKSIVAANGLVEPFVLRVGQRLLLPRAPTRSAEARAAAFKIDIDDIATGGTPADAASTELVQSYSARFAASFNWPLTGHVAERFGPAGKGRINHGIEIATSPGADIRAAATGTVAFVGNGGSAGYGGLILLRHGDGWISAYGRAGAATVARGQQVKAGDVIGRVGQEARLHFELRQNRAAVDPAKYLHTR